MSEHKTTPPEVLEAAAAALRAAVWVGGSENLLNLRIPGKEARRLEEALLAAGVDLTCTEWEEPPHAE